MSLSANAVRAFSLLVPPLFTEMPVDADATIYAGSALGEDVSTGVVRPLTDGDTFHGFAERAADNDGGANGDVDVLVRQQGEVELTVGGTLSDADLGAPVYATDDDTFSKTDSGSDTQIGKITRVISSTKAMVFFQGANVRSV
jgi:hypothetical protein